MAGENSGGRTVSGGTVYSMQEGRTVSGGTVYAAKEGRTIAGGTVYSIVMEEKTYTVTITGGGNATYCYVEIGGAKYSLFTTITDLPAGTVISCYARARGTTRSGVIKVNGETVASQKYTSSGAAAEYDYEIHGDTSIALNYNSSYSNVIIDITTA